MADTLTIAGTAVDLVATSTTLDLWVPFVKGGIPELHFSRMLRTLAYTPTPPPPALPDTWSGQAVTLQLAATGATIQFSGDVQGYVDRWMDGVGWVREYRALGLLNRAAYIPVTDSVSLTDTSIWNLPGDDPSFVGSRAGQTVGQIVTALLTMTQNATALNAAGIGAYTSMSPPTLPTATVNDLAALTIIPPWRVTVAGERLLAAIEQFVTTCHPNHFLHVQPDGTIRLLDTRTFAGNTLTLGSDPRLGMPMLTRDLSDNYSQVEIRGNTLVRAVTVATSPWPGSSSPDGGLQEDFAWGSYTNAQAKTNWLPTDWSQPNEGIGAPLATGSCTCPDTTHVTISTTLTFAANQLSQGGGDYLGQVLLYADTLGGSVNQIFQARIVANTATSGGSCTLTLDIAMPSTAYNSYKLFGLDAGANAVGRRYKVSNGAIASALQNYFPYPVPFVAATGDAAAMTSTPLAVVEYNPFGGTGTPYNTTSVGVTVDPVNGLVYLDMPAQVCAYGLNTPVKWPANVMAFLPVAVGTLSAYAPSSSSYAGTLYTVEGIRRTKIITATEWRDYSNQTNMNTFASEFLDAVKDVVVEGTVPYHGLMTGYLSPGQAVSIAGDGYTTGWESLALPVVSLEVVFQSGSQGTSYQTTLHLSNRRGRYSSANFLRPNITGAQLGADESFSVAGPTFTGVVNPGQFAGGFGQAAGALGGSLGQSASSAAGQAGQGLAAIPGAMGGQ